MSDNDLPERRVELIAKVAVLEEKHVNTQKQLDRIEDLITKHISTEESCLQKIHTALTDLKTHVAEQISDAVNPITTDLTNIKDDIIKYKGMIGGVLAVITVVGSLIAFLKDWFLAHWN